MYQSFKTKLVESSKDIKLNKMHGLMFSSSKFFLSKLLAFNVTTEYKTKCKVPFV